MARRAETKARTWDTQTYQQKMRQRNVMDTALNRETIDGALLCDVVGQVLDRVRVELGEWDYWPLAYDVKNGPCRFDRGRCPIA